MNRTFDPGLGLSVICDQLNTGGNVWGSTKAPVKAATTANISLTGRQTIDGVAQAVARVTTAAPSQDPTLKTGMVRTASAMGTA